MSPNDSIANDGDMPVSAWSSARNPSSVSLSIPQSV